MQLIIISALASARAEITVPRYFSNLERPGAAGRVGGVSQSRNCTVLFFMRAGSPCVCIMSRCRGGGIGVGIVYLFWDLVVWIGGRRRDCIILVPGGVSNLKIHAQVNVRLKIEFSWR